jgi:lactoylglutathione lyase
MTQRPFRVLGLQQIAIGGLDKDALGSLWIDMFGIPKVDAFASESENVDEYVLRLGEGPHAVEIDLMQPLEFGKRPLVYEPALNHIGLWIDDLAACVDWLTEHGVRFAPGGIRVGAGGHEMCFVHPKGNDEFPLGGQGVLIELIQAPDDVIAGLG